MEDEIKNPSTWMEKMECLLQQRISGADDAGHWVIFEDISCVDSQEMLEMIV